METKSLNTSFLRLVSLRTELLTYSDAQIRQFIEDIAETKHWKIFIEKD
jgi:hypothetical protein